METDNNSLEWNIRTLMVSLFQAAFSEIEANIMSGAQTVNHNETEMPLKNKIEEITVDDECAAFYKSVRDAEYNKLVDAYARENMTKEEKERNKIVREQEQIISAKEITDDDECAAFYSRLVDAYAREKMIQEEKERNRIVRQQEQIISAKEVTDDDECTAFYKSVRDAEYSRLVDAYAREKIIQEEKEINMIVREQEQIISAKEITDDDECAAFYKSVRDTEYNRLVDAYAKEKTIKEEKEINMIVREQEQIISAKEITDDDECAAFYKSVRDTEYNRLVDAYAKEKTIKEEKERNKIVREQEQIISAKEITDDDECAAFYKSVRDAEYNRLVDAYNKEKTIKEEKERNRIVREQEQISSAKEVTDDDECAAFYKSVRDAEYNRLVDAYAKEKTIKEEKERKGIVREQEQIKKQFEEFWKPATDIGSLRRDSQEPKDYKEKALTSQQEREEPYLKEEQVEIRQPGPFLSPAREERINSFVREQHYNYQSFQRTDMWNAEINKELDGSLISETVPTKKGPLQWIVNKVFKRSKPSTKDIIDKQLALKEELKLDLSKLDDETEDEDIPDTSRTSDSEWFSISLSDTEETPRPHLKPFFSSVLEETHVSTITSKTKESAIEIEVDFQSKPKSGFTSFRQWFCQLFCCHSKPDEDFEH
ncbi:trichohyalin-like [Mytilus trossulus]|uniref:trichohyalin-like n=1 Tax=Mytilus trossulus TaxID=6551 RepID=UPI0030056AFD